MRFVFLAIFVLLAAQPLPVAACDIHAGQETTLGTAHPMPDSAMDHDEQDMDCCDQGPDNAADGCDSLSRCTACPAGLVALAPSAIGMATGAVSRLHLPATGLTFNLAAAPPFRPPIA